MHLLTVALFATADANFRAVLQPYMDKANALLGPVQMRIDVYPTGGAADGPKLLAYSGVVFDGPGDPGTVRAQAHNAVPNGRGIPVIFCKRQTDDTGGFGFEFGSTIQTDSAANNGIGWLPYILINTQIKSSGNEVLLHELIHASYGAQQPGHDTDPTSVFFEYGNGQPNRILPAKHLDALRRAYFSAYTSS
jgi:hypothetical protein